MSASPLNLYDVTIPSSIHSLEALSKFLAKAANTPSTATLDPSTLPSARIIEDMAPLTFQVQTACNSAKFLAVRVAGVPNVSMDDTETTFPELIARIEKTVDFLKTKVTRADFEGKEGGEIDLHGRKFSGLTYVTVFALPNFYFHVTAAYCILRGRGIDVGKLDYLTLDKERKDYLSLKAKKPGVKVELDAK